MVFWSACIGRNHLCCGNPDFIDALYKRKQYIFETGLNLESAAFFFQKRDGGLWIFHIRTVYSHAGQWRKYRDTIEYFFLDSSYISILLQYGLIMFVMILILWGIIGLRARKEKDWVLLWILAIIAFQSIMEQHLLDISYNPFLWILFAETGKKRKQKKISGAEKNI